MTRLLAAFVASVSIIGIAASTGDAAQPPPGYPSNQVMATADNPVLGSLPLRRGFWDHDGQNGFGMDKAWHRHKIQSLSGMKFVMESPLVSNSGNQSILRAYVGRYECPDGRPGECALTAEREVRAIVDERAFREYYGWPAGDPLGLVTMYCMNPDDAIDCPAWVTHAFNYPGQDGLLRSAPSPEGRNAPRPAPSRAPSSLDATRTPSAAATPTYLASYEPPPATMPVD
jgi:hypothetical protein